MICQLIKYGRISHLPQYCGFPGLDRGEFSGASPESMLFKGSDLLQAVLDGIFFSKAKLEERAGNLLHASASTEMPISSPDSS